MIKLYSFMIDCPDPEKLARFYAALLDWEVVFVSDEYACAGARGTHQGAYPCLTFQKNEDYTPPVWPDEPHAQQQMAHLDFAVDDIPSAVEHALKCGAQVAKAQFDEHWKVMIDPAGHPFCLCDMKQMMQSEHFALI